MLLRKRAAGPLCHVRGECLARTGPFATHAVQGVGAVLLRMTGRCK